MPKATWNGTVIAESDATQIIDGNHYFPPESIKDEFFQKTDHTSVCGWKGEASYYTITVDGQSNENAAWYYPSAKAEAKKFEGFVAFWKGVEVQA